jgi:outer membrane receptor protein involved in Fe transport
LSASGWVSLIDGKITRQPATFDGRQEIDGAPVRRRINADSAYFAGADLSVETASIEGFNLFGYLSAVDGAVESADPQPQFEPGALHGLLSGKGTDWANPRRLPPFSYKLGLEFAPEQNWYARVYAQGAAAQSKLGPGDIDDERICETAPGVLYGDLGESCPGTGGWTTLNLRGGWAPEEFIRFDLAVENLTDLRYKYHGSGPPAPGVNGKLLLTLRNP